MTDSLWPLALATLGFVAGHIGISSTPLRGMLVRRMGQGPYLGTYSALMGILLILMIVSYGMAPAAPVLWVTPLGLRWVTLALMLAASVLLVIGLTATNPTAVMQGDRARDETIGSGPLAITRHPMLWAFALWAIAHLLVNGDAASVILMGGVGVLALSGTVLIDAKRRAAGGEVWRSFAGRTSNLPFAAIVAGRARFSPSRIGWTRIGGGVALFVLLLLAHPLAIGVSPLPVPH